MPDRMAAFAVFDWHNDLEHHTHRGAPSLGRGGIIRSGAMQRTALASLTLVSDDEALSSLLLSGRSRGGNAAGCANGPFNAHGSASDDRGDGDASCGGWMCDAGADGVAKDPGAAFFRTVREGALHCDPHSGDEAGLRIATGERGSSRGAERRTCDLFAGLRRDAGRHRRSGAGRQMAHRQVHRLSGGWDEVRFIERPSGRPADFFSLWPASGDSGLGHGF